MQKVARSIIRQGLLLVAMGFFFCSVHRPVSAKDLGVQGELFPIQETSLLNVIEGRVLAWQKQGDVSQHINALKQQVEAQLKHLPYLAGITPATQNRVRLFNPSVVATQLITDDAGTIITMPGQVINPLDNVNIASPLVFMNLDREEERAWLDKDEQGLKKTAMIILVGGDAIKAMENLGRRVYYDNHGLLVKRLSLQHTPTIVTQVNQELRLEERKV